MKGERMLDECKLPEPLFLGCRRSQSPMRAGSGGRREGRVGVGLRVNRHTKISAVCRGSHYSRDLCFQSS